MVVDYKAMATSGAKRIGCVVNRLNVWYEGEPDIKLKYCPDSTAARNAGRPKKGTRIPSAIEVVGGKKRNKKHPYCVWCNKYNHTSDNCFNHPWRKDKDDEE